MIDMLRGSRARQLACIGCLVSTVVSCASGEEPRTPGDELPAAGRGGSAAPAGQSGMPVSAAGSGGEAGRIAPPPGGSGAGGRGGGGGTAGNAGGAAAGQSGAAAGSGASGEPHATLYVRDGALYDRCGEKVVLRGINHPTLYVDRSGSALPEIAKTGANAVRLFWYARMNIQIGEAEAAISAAIKAGMIPILELHDSTCMWNLDPIVSYWTSSQAVALIQKYQGQLILNIANEPSPPNANEFRTKYSSVVMQMRKAGIHTPLMIDGGNCGRDYNVLLAQGQAVLDADPDHNLIFSTHLYDRMSQSSYAQLFQNALSKKLALVVGEFANKTPPGCGAALDYTALITEANTQGIGWLAWSWGDNDPNSDWNSDCGEFDMTSTFAYDSLRSWGKEVAVSLPASIKNTAVRPASMRNGSCNK